MARLRKRGRRPGGPGGPGGPPGGGGEPPQPSITRADLEPKTVTELKAMGADMGLDLKALRKKDEVIEAVLAAKVKAEGFIDVAGVLDLMNEGYGFLRTSGYLPGDRDVYVPQGYARRFGLRRGDLLEGQTRPAKEGEKYAALTRLDRVNGKDPESARGRRDFKDLTPVYPDERLRLERVGDNIIGRIIDLIAPIGKGQRGLIVSPPKAGKTTILKDIANSITANNPECYLLCLLVDERPEEVTDMERSIRGEVVSSTFDMPADNHVAVAELVLARAKRMCESGYDVVILLDSITRLARAYNLAQPASGRILSGGVDSTALYPPKKFFGAARNIEHGGSITIMATALVDTGSKMDEVIFEEFKGTGNMELRLDRRLADKRIFPAIDVVTSGTRKEELILDPVEAPYIWALRRQLHSADGDQQSDRITEQLIRLLKQTKSNREFLATIAKARAGVENGSS
jgi:transcription termination factor Rho